MIRKSSSVSALAADQLNLIIVESHRTHFRQLIKLITMFFAILQFLTVVGVVLYVTVHKTQNQTLMLLLGLGNAGHPNVIGIILLCCVPIADILSIIAILRHNRVLLCVMQYGRALGIVAWLGALLCTHTQLLHDPYFWAFVVLVGVYLIPNLILCSCCYKLIGEERKQQAEKRSKHHDKGRAILREHRMRRSRDSQIDCPRPRCIRTDEPWCTADMQNQGETGGPKLTLKSSICTPTPH